MHFSPHPRQVSLHAYSSPASKTHRHFCYNMMSHSGRKASAAVRSFLNISGLMGKPGWAGYPHEYAVIIRNWSATVTTTVNTSSVNKTCKVLADKGILQ